MVAVLVAVLGIVQEVVKVVALEDVVEVVRAVAIIIVVIIAAIFVKVVAVAHAVILVKDLVQDGVRMGAQALVEWSVPGHVKTDVYLVLIHVGGAVAHVQIVVETNVLQVVCHGVQVGVQVLAGNSIYFMMW